MVYKNKGGQSRERTMVAAYSLVKDFGAKQTDVAKTLGCSQATVANWVKEVGYEAKINGLQQELADAQSYIEELKDEMNNNYLTYEEPESYFEEPECEFCDSPGIHSTDSGLLCNDCHDHYVDGYYRD